MSGAGLIDLARRYVALSDELETVRGEIARSVLNGGGRPPGARPCRPLPRPSISPPGRERAAEARTDCTANDTKNPAFVRGVRRIGLTFARRIPPCRRPHRLRALRSSWRMERAKRKAARRRPHIFEVCAPRWRNADFCASA